MSEHTAIPWKVIGWDTIVNIDKLKVAKDLDSIDAEFIVLAANNHEELVKAAKAACAYDAAILSCGDDPEAMSSFCTAEGTDLDALYLDWITKSRNVLAKIEKEK